jgi:hypothetical protein
VREGSGWLGVRLHAGLLTLLLLLSAAVRVKNIEGTLPYPQHPDEQTLLRQVTLMVQNRSLNPHAFYKPTLPTYVLTAAILAGDGVAMLVGKARRVRDIGTPSHFEHSRGYPVQMAMLAGKYLFAALSLAALALLGLLAWRVSGEVALLWLAPLVACCSPSYFRISWLYLNVDVPGALAAVGTVLYLVTCRQRDVATGRRVNGAKRSLVIGLLAGLTVGSKFNLFPILVPCALWFWFYERERAFWRVLVMGSTAVLTVLLTTPYAVLSPHEFMLYMQLQSNAYVIGGRLTADVGRGWPSVVVHATHFLNNFGWVGLALAVYGIYRQARRDGKTAWLLFSYPLAFVMLMCAQVRYYERNLAGVDLLVALAVTLGGFELAVRGAGLLRSRNLGPDRLRVPIAALCVAAAFAVTVPWPRVAWAYSFDLDPRKKAAAWINGNLELGATLLLQEDAYFDERTLRKGFEVATVPAANSRAFRAWNKTKPAHAFLLVKESDVDDYETALRTKRRAPTFVRISGTDPGRGEQRRTALVLLEY